MNTKQATEIVGGLSSPSKMPCYGFSIPASKCITGAKLRAVAGSVCSQCYAFRGKYPLPVVQNAMKRRFDNLNHPQWVEAMSSLINAVEKSGYFRWHDSGDLQSVEHLSQIVEVCKLNPTIKHWLPTREYSIVSNWIKKNGTVPANLTIRLSALSVESAPPSIFAKDNGLVTSTVSKHNHTCPASSQGGKCNDCRLCWDKDTTNVAYKKH